MKFLASCILLFVPTTTLANPPPEAAVCIGCHQADGAGKANMAPALRGLSADYMQAQIAAFKSGKRQNPVMTAMIASLDSSSTKAVSNYFAQLPVPPTEERWKGDQDNSDEPASQLIFEGDWERNIPACVSCHGPSLIGVGGHFPRLAGQQPDYIISQLKAWQSGQRSDDNNQLMSTVAKRLSDQDIDTLATAIYQLGGK